MVIFLFYWAHVTSLTCKANVQPTNTSHTWNDIVLKYHQRRFHCEKSLLAPSFKPVTFQPRSKVLQFVWAGDVPNCWSVKISKSFDTDPLKKHFNVSTWLAIDIWLMRWSGAWGFIFLVKNNAYSEILPGESFGVPRFEPSPLGLST